MGLFSIPRLTRDDFASRALSLVPVAGDGFAPDLRSDWDYVLATINVEGMNSADIRAAVVGRLDAHADAMQALLSLLDMMDGDPDFEPTLGAPECKVALPWGCGFVQTSDGDQTLWAEGSTHPGADDAETVNEDGGDILDGPELSEPIRGGSEIGVDALECGQ